MSVKFSGTFGRLVIDVNPHQAVLFSLYAREANSLQQLYTSAHTVRNRIRFPFGRDYMHALPVCNVLMSLYTRLFIFRQNTIYSCCWCVLCIRVKCVGRALMEESQWHGSPLTPTGIQKFISCARVPFSRRLTIALSALLLHQSIPIF
jgi:hypothetical protein